MEQTKIRPANHTKKKIMLNFWKKLEYSIELSADIFKNAGNNNVMAFQVKNNNETDSTLSLSHTHFNAERRMHLHHWISDI